MPSLLIADTPRDRQHFVDVMNFAMQRGILWTDRGYGLLQRLSYLAGYGENGPVKSRCTIMADWAPHSFRFRVEQSVDGGETWKSTMNGGIIYSGPGQPLDGSAPAMTVSIDPDLQEGWSTHT